MEKKREDLTPAEEIAAIVALASPKRAALVNPYPGMSMDSRPFRIFRNVKKNKRAAAKRRNVLRERARQ